jgi:hypothetical protein
VNLAVSRQLRIAEEVVSDRNAVRGEHGAHCRIARLNFFDHRYFFISCVCVCGATSIASATPRLLPLSHQG